MVLSIIWNNDAQITIADNSDNDLTNKTALMTDEKLYFNITNQGSSEITFIVQVTSFTLPADANDILVCACGSCLPVSLQNPPFVVGDPTILTAGATYGSNQADVDYDSNGSTQPANITIKVYEQGNETNFAQFTLDTEYTSGIKNLQNKEPFSIYPNPANGLFTVSTIQDFPNSEIRFSNILGKTIKQMAPEGQKTQFSAKDFSPGIYFVTLYNNKEILSTKKLIIK